MASKERTKYALVTGCTPGGIGHYLALEFAAKGVRVLATVRDPSKYTSPDPNIIYLPLELTSQESIQSLKDEVSKITGGKLDILYNNAGRNYTVPALDLEPEETEDLFKANVFSVMHMCKAFAPLLIEAKGTIVQTGSLAAVMPYVWGSAYCASKAALHAYSNTLRLELAPFDVRVLTIVTGGVKSNIARVHRELPQDSYNLPLNEQYQRRLKHSQELGMDTQQYTRRCVRQVLQRDGWFGPRHWIWEGKMSWIVWYFYTWWPNRCFDWYMNWVFKLGRLRGTAGPDKKNA